MSADSAASFGTGMTATPQTSPKGLYVLVDGAVHADADLAPICRDVQASGATWIQLRIKERTDQDAFRLLERCCYALDRPETVLWVNDRPDFAALLPVRGVHLGQEDMPPEAARLCVGSNLLIGQSTHSGEQVRKANSNSAVDVIAIGPVFGTVSKHDAEPTVGLGGLRRARQLTSKPLVAIGGIDLNRYREIRQCGADLVAMIGALGQRDDIAQRVAALVEHENLARP